jgi:signal transduction histidine kinase/DNA-binding response OmpR family regulator
VLGLRQENGQWRIKYQFHHIKHKINSILEEEGSLWLTSPTKGVLKLNFPGEKGEVGKPIVTPYRTGLPEDGVYCVTRGAGHVMFAASTGIFRFDETSGSFIPDTTLGDNFSNGSRNVFRLLEDQNKHIWFHSSRKNYHAVPQQDGTFAVDVIPFLRFPHTQVNGIYPDGQTAWFAAEDGLVCYDTTVKTYLRRPVFAFVRKVTIQGGGLVYNGFKTINGTTAVWPVLEYKDRNLRFEAAAPFFQLEFKTSYQYFMKGYDRDWSQWTRDPFKDYTNLDAGKYTFRIRARNVFEDVSKEDTFSFRILPPWYRTWWMVMVYAVAAILMMALLVKWRSRKLILEKQRLETIVDERTREIHQASAQLQKKTTLLEEQSEKLKEMDKVKSRFFANISHEFRTPLTLIMGPLDQIRCGYRDKELTKRVDLAYRNAQRLLGLINQLLDLARFESGKMELQVVQKDLVPFLKGVLESFQLAAAQQRLNLTFRTAETSIPLYFDPGKLEKVMNNLLSNAVKFTPAGGGIYISLTVTSPAGEKIEDCPGSEGGVVNISVKDTGIGIPQDQLMHIFERFYQAETTVEHHLKGSGIGLALVKELVELHHGQMIVHSKQGENSGTEFILRFPMGKKHLRPEEIAEIYLPSPGEGETPGISPLDTESIEPVEPDEKKIDLSVEMQKDTPGKDKDIVLVVEDNADLRHYVRGSLEPDYTVVEAKDGQEGIEKAKAVIPDLIISDIMMPKVDGYQLCRMIKNDISTSHIPVILLTAKASEENIEQGLETGADDYITKPFNTRLLCARIKNLIDLRRQLQLNLNREMVLQPSYISVSKIDREFLGDLQKVLRKNVSDPEFNVEDLSKRLFMSRTTLYRKVMALSGETPTDFIRSYRLKWAAQLLKRNPGSVTEVAFEVGFSSRAYFTKCFKEKFHRLPSEYISSESDSS